MKAAVIFLAIIPLLLAKPLEETDLDLVELQRRVNEWGLRCDSHHPNCMNWYPGDAAMKVVGKWFKDHALDVGVAVCSVVCASGSLPLELASAGLSAGLCTAACQTLKLAGK